MQDTTNDSSDACGQSALTDGLGGELTWRCFHCCEVFTDPAEAALHFGTRIYDAPACQVDVAKLRDLERQLDRYREEDTDLHREIHRLHSDYQTKLMREEEKGYARGLHDGMNMTPEQKAELTTPNAELGGRPLADGPA